MLHDGHLFSVKMKGSIVFGAIISCAILISLFVFHQKNLLLRDFDKIQASLEIDGMVKAVENVAFQAAMDAFDEGSTAGGTAGMERLRPQYQLLHAKYAELREHLPEVALNLNRVDAAYAEADGQPSRATMSRLVVELARTKDEFGGLAQQLQDVRKQMAEQYRQRTDSVAMTTLFLGMSGLALLGAIMALFFRRLTIDLGVLRTRALDIVNGYRGKPIAIRRHDEVGQLMAAVNSMATALDKREKELIVERQKSFHQEKMAAIGTLAAGVAHEIGNPIAAIAGIAQQMQERYAEHHCAGDAEGNCPHCQASLIQEQTARLAAITREISEFASPQPAEPQLLDLNALLRSTSNLIRYDKRLHRIDLQLNLDHHLPAIHGVADQIVQVIMNLLINAMDALDTVTDRQPTIIVLTMERGDHVCLSVEDNGPGMEDNVRERVFDAFFTTKPAGKGTGLGLSLCYSIMNNHGGTIEIESAPGKGTRVQVCFPLDETA